MNIHLWVSMFRKHLEINPLPGLIKRIRHSLKEAADSSARFVGVWALEYMKLTYKHLKSKGSRAKLTLVVGRGTSVAFFIERTG